MNISPLFVALLVSGSLITPLAWAQSTPTSVAELIQQAMVSANRRDWETSARLYEQALIQEPTNAALYNNLAVIRRRQGNIPAAITAYQQALRLDSTLTEAYVNLGIAYLLNQQWSPAITVLRQAQVQGRTDASVGFYLGLAHERLGQWEQALPLYQQFTQAQPQAFAFYRLAIVAWQTGRGSLALEAFRNAARLDSTVSLFRSEAGLAFAKMGETQEAIEWLQGLPETWAQPTDYVVLARLAFQEQRYDVAATAMTQALNLSPTPPLTLISDAAVIQTRQEDNTDLALTQLQQAVLAIPPQADAVRRDFAVVLTNLSALYVQQQDYAQAQALGERAMQWDPDFAPAYNITAVALLAQAQPAPAKALLEMAVTKPDPSWQMHRNLGVAYALLGDRPAATLAWETAFSQAPSVDIQRALNDELVRLQQSQLPDPVPSASPSPAVN
ncbi:MAG: hypothetical protein OHK0012_26780 [Synechococcales cyanobacterium]